MLPHVNSTVFLITRMHRRKCVGNLPISLSSPPFLKDAPNSRPGEFWGPTPQCCSIPLVLILPDSTSSNAAAREGQGKYRPQRNTRNQGHCNSTLKSSENLYHAKKNSSKSKCLDSQQTVPLLAVLLLAIPDPDAGLKLLICKMFSMHQHHTQE